MTSTDALSLDASSPPHPQRAAAQLSPQRMEAAAEGGLDPDSDVKAAFASAPPDGSAMIAYAVEGEESPQGSEEADLEEDEDQPFGVPMDHRGDVSGVSRHVRAFEVLPSKPVPKRRVARSGTPPPCPVFTAEWGYPRNISASCACFYQ